MSAQLHRAILMSATSALFLGVCAPGTGVAQIGLPTEEARADVNLTDAGLMEGAQWWDAVLPSGDSRGYQVAFYDGVVAAIRLRGYRFDAGQVTAGLREFNWQQDGKRRVELKWMATTVFQSAFPPFGKSFSWASPLTRTVGRQRTVTFDPRTGRVLGVSPWSDLNVPTGEFQVQTSSEGYFVDTLVSRDGTAYAFLIANPSQYGAYSSQGIRRFIICNAWFFWRYGSHLIRSDDSYAFDDYESALKRFVPTQLHDEVRRRRLAAFAAGLIDTSSLPQEMHFQIAEDAVSFGEITRAALFDRVAENLNTQTAAIQSRRINVLAHVYRLESIETLVSLRAAAYQQRRKPVVTEVEALIHGIAADEGLPQPPVEGMSQLQWTAWLDSVTQND